MITPDIIKRVKTEFEAWQTLEEEKKEITKQISQGIKEIAEAADVKPKEMRKVFTAWKKRMDKGEDEIENLYKLSVELEGN